MSSYQNSSGNQPVDKPKHTANSVTQVGDVNRNAEQMVDGYSMKAHKQNQKKLAKKAKGK